MEKERLGDFEIIRQMGKGPLGTIYLGEHTFIKRRFALKVLPEELAKDPLFIDRLQKEVGKYAVLDHINIAKIHNVSFDRGVYFIVSDYISDKYGESKNISQYLSSLEGRLSEKEVFSILKQVAYASDYLHQKGLLHGSLKLNNIVLGKFEEKIPHIYLTDAGLSPIIGHGKILTNIYLAVAETLDLDIKCTGCITETRYNDKDYDRSKLTKLHRSFLQNYAFLAPEQKLGGSLDKTGPKSDIYAFGVLAYFLLMGYLPEGYFKMPSKVLDTISFDWDLLIEATMRQNPDERPDSLVALLEQIALRELKEFETNIKKIVEPRAEASKYFDESSAPLEKITPLQPIIKEEELEPKPILNPSELKKFEYEEDPGSIFQTGTIVAPYRPKVKEVQEVEPMLTEMVVIEGGEYMRGSNVGARDEKPKHKIFIDAFALDIHPVTNEQFIRFLEVMGSEKDVSNNDTISLKESRIKRVAGKLIIESGYAKHPVVGVSWYGAKAYAKWVGKRLPTEAEWEIAATQGKEENIYPFGQVIERVQANFFSSDTTPVMSYKPTASGLYDMAGNVYEWCEDWYGYNYYEQSLIEPTNPKGPHQGVYRVLRGGCWKSLKEDLRSSHRHRNNPGTVNRTCGFRCAANVG